MSLPNPQRDARIAALREEGISVRAIAERLGVTEKGIYYALYRHRDRSGAGGLKGKGQPASDHPVATLPPPPFEDRFAWLDAAACKDQPVEVFFWNRDGRGGEAPAPPGYYDRALQICAMCPVRRECFQFGYRERYGVWGGTTRKERWHLGQARAWRRSQGRMLRAFRGQEVGEDKW